MKKIRALIVDDEESARDVLENLILRFCPDVNVVDKCNNVLDAVDIIKRENPDLVFLDIEMPKYAGYEIVDFFEKINFKIVFVTAYDHYAIKAFEIAAIDYLLKPVDIERLKMAIERANLQLDIQQNFDKLNLLKNNIKNKQFTNIVINEKSQQYLIEIEKIIAIEAQESYSTIHTIDKKYMISKNLKHFESIFSNNLNFIRVHRSWMINKSYMLNYSKSDLIIQLEGGLCAKLSKYKKAEFESAILS